MKMTLNILATLLLLINGIGALYGGGSLILHPDGSGIQLPLVLLKNSGFSSYLIPGIILFVANGLFSFFVLATIITKAKYASLYIMVQGAILIGWILIQVMLTNNLYYFHFLFFACGMLMMMLGWMLGDHLRFGEEE